MTLKNVLLGVMAAVFVAALGLFVWARSVLSQEAVRKAIAARIADAIGQPVAIGGISAGIYPRITVNLTDVSIGQPAAVTVASLDIRTDFGALLSKRIEHGSMRLSGARIKLPLPRFAVASQTPQTGTSSSSGASAVEIGSIDEILVSDVDIVSGGRTLHGDIEVVPHSKGLDVKKITITAGPATVNVTGRITDLAGPTGELTVKAGALDLAQLLAFASDFSKGSGVDAAPAGTAPSSARTPAPAAPSEMDLAVTMDAERASIGALQLEKLSGRARITNVGMTLDPAAFGIFGGRYEGTLALALGNTPEFRIKARLSGIDMVTATQFAGMPNTITGRMSGNVDVSGKGTDVGTVSRTAKGRVRLDVTDGIVKNLGLIQAVVLATSMRSGALAQGTGSRDEPFTRLGGTLAIGNGVGTTDDLRLESKDVSLAVTGSVRLDGSAIDLKGVAQLSEALSHQAGKDLVRYTQEQGRVTLPAAVEGSASSPRVRIDVGDLAKRAARNRVNEEAQKAVAKGLGSLLRGR
jgi:uncharacterized protein involved in outer membrane biogenesis